MAYLKYYAEHGNEEKPSAEVAVGFLRQLLDKNIYFPFYRDYMKIMPELKRFADKTMLEYKTHPGCKCVIHYMLSSGAEEARDYCHELYCAGHMMEAAAAYYEATGKDRLLKVMS